MICEDSINPTTDADKVTYIKGGRCMPKMKSTEALRRCIPNDSKDEIEAKLVAQYSAITSDFSEMDDYSSGESKGGLEGVVGDMWSQAGIVFGFGFGFSMAAGIAFLFILRIPGFLTILIWSIFASIFVVFAAGGGMLYSMGMAYRDEDPKVHSDSEADNLIYCAYACFALAGIWLLLMIAMRKRVALAIGVVKEAARALGNMWALTLFPILQVVGVALFLIPWLYYTVYLFSSGDIKTSEKTMNGQTVQVRTVEYDNNTRYAFLYLLFCWFWTSQVWLFLNLCFFFDSFICLVCGRFRPIGGVYELLFLVLHER